MKPAVALYLYRNSVMACFGEEARRDLGADSLVYPQAAKTVITAAIEASILAMIATAGQ